MSTKVALFQALLTAASDGMSSGPNVASVGKAFDGVQQVAANCYSLPLLLDGNDTIQLQISQPSTATGQGTITLQGCNFPFDPKNPLANSSLYVTPAPLQWGTIGFWDESTQAWLSSKTLTNTAPTSVLLTVPVLGCRAFRVLYTNTAGTAAVRMDLMTKSDGH